MIPRPATRSVQLDFFARAPQGAAPRNGDADALDVEAELRRQDEARLARLALLRDAQLRLAARRLWGFPNVVRNPDGPWASLRGGAFDLRLSLLCWPGYYLVRAGADGVQRVTLHVRPGCDGNPALSAAVQVLADLAPVSLAPCTSPHIRYEAS